jgi:hypothetical protein
VTVTAASFQADYPFFSGRSQGAVARSIATATARFGATSCGDLHEAIIVAAVVVDLLRDPMGAPTSKTKDSNTLAENAEKRLAELIALVPVRVLVVGD